MLAPLHVLSEASHSISFLVSFLVCKTGNNTALLPTTLVAVRDKSSASFVYSKTLWSYRCCEIEQVPGSSIDLCKRGLPLHTPSVIRYYLSSNSPIFSGANITGSPTF